MLSVILLTIIGVFSAIFTLAMIMAITNVAEERAGLFLAMVVFDTMMLIGAHIFIGYAAMVALALAHIARYGVYASFDLSFFLHHTIADD